MTAAPYFDMIAPETARLWDGKLRGYAVDLLSKQSPFLPPTKLLDRTVAKQLVSSMSSADLAEALRSDYDED